MDELAGLSQGARKLAMERFRLLQPHLEQNESLISVAKAAGIPYRTAHRLVSEYRRHGLAALVRKQAAPTKPSAQRSGCSWWCAPADLHH